MHLGGFPSWVARNIRCWAPIVAVCLLPAPARAEEAISHISPNKQFGIRIVEPAGEAPRVELVTLQSRQKLIALNPQLAQRGVAIHWSPDSRHFAAGDEEAEHDPPGTFRTIEVYKRAGETFKKVELPDLRYPADHWPKETSRATGIESISALRWIDPATLLVERTTSSAYGPNAEKFWRLTAAITLRFDPNGKAKVLSVKKQKDGSH